MAVNVLSWMRQFSFFSSFACALRSQHLVRKEIQRVVIQDCRPFTALSIFHLHLQSKMKFRVIALQYSYRA